MEAKYYKRDSSGATLCHISNSNAVVSGHVEISSSGFFTIRFFFSSVKLRNFVPIMFQLHNLTPKKQFPGTKDISGLRDAEKTVYSQTLLNNTCIKIKDINNKSGAFFTKTLDCLNKSRNGRFLTLYYSGC